MSNNSIDNRDLPQQNDKLVVHSSEDFRKKFGDDVNNLNQKTALEQKKSGLDRLRDKISRMLESLRSKTSNENNQQNSNNSAKKTPNINIAYDDGKVNTILFDDWKKRNEQKNTPIFVNEIENGGEKVSMKSLFLGDSEMIKLIEKYQKNDNISVKKFQNANNMGLRQMGGVDYASTSIKIVDDKNMSKDQENVILKNEMMHVLLNQNGFFSSSEPIFPAVVQTKNGTINASVDKLQIHEIISDYGSMHDKNPIEIKRQITGSLSHFYGHILGDMQVRNMLRPGYFYSEEVGMRALEKIFGNLESYVKTKRLYRSTDAMAESVFEDMKKKTVTVDGETMSGVDYFVYAKSKESNRLLNEVVFNPDRQKSRVQVYMNA